MRPKDCIIWETLLTVKHLIDHRRKEVARFREQLLERKVLGIDEPSKHPILISIVGTNMLMEDSTHTLRHLPEVFPTYAL